MMNILMQQGSHIAELFASMGPNSRVALFLIALILLYVATNWLLRIVIIYLKKVPLALVFLGRWSYRVSCKVAKFIAAGFKLTLLIILHTMQAARRMVEKLVVSILWFIWCSTQWLYKSLIWAVRGAGHIAIKAIRAGVVFVLNIYKIVARILYAVTVFIISSILRTGVILKSGVIKVGKGIIISARYTKVFLFTHRPTRRMFKLLAWAIVVLIHILFGAVVCFLFAGYLLLLLPQGVVSEWSLELVRFNYHDMLITVDELSILIPLVFIVLFALLTGLHRLKEFLRSPIEAKRMSLFTRVFFQGVLVLSVSGMIIVLWEEFYVWSWAGIVIVLVTGFLNLFFSYLFMISQPKMD